MMKKDEALQAALNRLDDVQLTDNTWRQAMEVRKEIEKILHKLAEDLSEQTQPAKYKLVTCPQCLLVFDGNAHATDTQPSCPNCGAKGGGHFYDCIVLNMKL